MRRIFFCFVLFMLSLCLSSCCIRHIESEWIVDAEPSCTQAGSQHKECKECKKILSVQAIPQIVHTPTDWVTERDATCTEEGIRYRFCSACNSLLQEEIIPALGHTPVKDEAVASTYDSTGLTEGSHCSVCQAVLVAQEEVEMLTSYHVIFKINDADGQIIGQKEQTIIPGNATASVQALSNIGKRFVKWSDESTDMVYPSFIPTGDVVLTAVFEEETDAIPVLSIHTGGQAATINKDSWISATVSASYTDEQYCFENLSGKIKGRGNSTWGMPKRPYKLKLDAKENLFGLGKAKNWVLLANYDDPSSLRTQLALRLGKELIDIRDYTTDTLLVEVYLDDVYIGLYNLVEQIETGTNRVNISEDYTVADTGFIVELDFRAPSEGTEGIDYFVCNGNYYAVKDPDPDGKLTSEEMTFIRDYFDNCINALQCTNHTAEDYEAVKALIDVDTFAATYIIQELFKSVDIGDLSFYFYKDAGGKLCSGPIWDFDITAGNCDYSNTSVLPNYLYAKGANYWYRELLKFDDFVALVGNKLHESYEEIEACIHENVDFALHHRDSFYRNFHTWQTIGIYVWPNAQKIVDIKTWEGNVDYLNTWLSESLSYLMETYPKAVENHEDAAYKIKIASDEHVTVYYYETSDYSSEPIPAEDNVWSRNSDTGEFTFKDGQINIKLVFDEGYELDSISADDSSKYKNLKGPADTGIENVYRITKINGNFILTIASKEQQTDSGEEGFIITFSADHAAVVVYPTQDYTQEGITALIGYSRDSSTGDKTQKDGQCNFKIVLEEGYELENVIVTGGYKNLKTPEDTGNENTYRITKITSNLQVSIIVKQSNP